MKQMHEQDPIQRETRPQPEAPAEETAPLFSSPDTLTEFERLYSSSLAYNIRKLQRVLRKKMWFRRLDFFFGKLKAIGISPAL